MSRLIVLDTETTGLETRQGHRIIEIGCVELLERRPSGRNLHHYINPQRAIDAGAQAVHGITAAFLEDKPVFASIAAELLAFIDGAELVIHNAPFDVGFIDAELARLGTEYGCVTDHAGIIDTLPMARRKYPGQKNTLDALCRRLGVDNSARQTHGALLDAQLLADVYLSMTVGQGSLQWAAETSRESVAAVRQASGPRQATRVQHADAAEQAAHAAWLDKLDTDCAQGSVWRRTDSA